MLKVQNMNHVRFNSRIKISPELLRYQTSINTKFQNEIMNHKCIFKTLDFQDFRFN